MGIGNGNKGGRCATATRAIAMAAATTWAMPTATRVVGDIEGNGEGARGDGDGKEGGSQVRGRWQGWKEQWKWRQRG